MWPDFTQPTSLPNSATWTATFDSYNQRTEEVYYCITVHTLDSQPVSFMACVDYAWATDGMDEEAIAHGLKVRLGEIALTGKTNTTYQSNGPGRGGVVL